MNLDLDQLTAGWDYREGEICARMLIGRDGSEVLQLRIDLGVLQMFPDGRPDGTRYKGHGRAIDYLQPRLGDPSQELLAEDWQELERELVQLNYRRLALASLAESAVAAHDIDATRTHLSRALRDVEECLENLDCLCAHCEGVEADAALRPTLVLARAKLTAQLFAANGQIDDAIEATEAGIAELDDALAEAGFEPEQRENDAGLLYLRQFSRRLRREYGVEMTLNERLQAAIDQEDFETAAKIRDELRERASDWNDPT